MVKRNPTCNGCEECGDKLSGLNRCCCTHVCHAICLTLQPSVDALCPDSDDCGCNETVFIYALYDPATESFHGNVGCGNVSIPYEIYIRYDKTDGNCYACLVSPCNSGTGSGTGVSGTGSFEVTEQCVQMGKATSNCIGERGTGGELTGGMSFEWELSTANCGDDDCSATYTLTAVCVDRIFPEELTEDYLGYGCKGCKCLCRDLCVTWSYNGPPYSGTGSGTGTGFVSCSMSKKLSYDSLSGGWTAEFIPNERRRLLGDLDNNPIPVVFDMSEPGECRSTINLLLQKNEITGACELLVSSEIGTGSESGTANITETVVALDNCPELEFSLELNEYETLSVKCWECNDCPDYSCLCKCRKLGPSLTAEIVTAPTPNVCFGKGQTGTISLSGPYESPHGCLWWGLGSIDANPMLIVFELNSFGVAQLSVYGCPIPVNGPTMGSELLIGATSGDGNCSVLNFEFEVTWNDVLVDCFSDDGDNYDPPEPYQCPFKVFVTE